MVKPRYVVAARFVHQIEAWQKLKGVRPDEYVWVTPRTVMVRLRGLTMTPGFEVVIHESWAEVSQEAKDALDAQLAILRVVAGEVRPSLQETDTRRMRVDFSHMRHEDRGKILALVRAVQLHEDEVHEVFHVHRDGPLWHVTFAVRVKSGYESGTFEPAHAERTFIIDPNGLPAWIVSELRDAI